MLNTALGRNSLEETYPEDLEHFDPFDKNSKHSNANNAFVKRKLPKEMWLHIASFMPIKTLCLLVGANKFFFKLLVKPDLGSSTVSKGEERSSLDIVSQYSRIGFNYILERLLFNAFPDYGIFITEKREGLEVRKSKSSSNVKNLKQVKNELFYSNTYDKMKEIVTNLETYRDFSVCWKRLDIEHAELNMKPTSLCLIDITISKKNIQYLMSRRGLEYLDEDEDHNSYGFAEDIYDQPPVNTWSIFVNHVFSPKLKYLTINDCHFSLDIHFDWYNMNLVHHCPNLKRIEIKLYEKYHDWLLDTIRSLKSLETVTFLPGSELSCTFYQAVTKSADNISHIKELNFLDEFTFDQPLDFLQTFDKLERLTIQLRSYKDVKYIPTNIRSLTISLGGKSSTEVPNIKFDCLKQLAVKGGVLSHEQWDSFLKNTSQNVEQFTIAPAEEFNFSKSLTYFTKLKTVSISNIYFASSDHSSVVSKFFTNNKNLVSLDMSGSVINYTKSIVNALPKSLREINLEGTIAQLPTHIKLDKLTFTINGKQDEIVQSLDYSVWKESLKELCIYGSEVHGLLSVNICKLQNLEKLVLVGIGFEKIPKDFYSMKSLKHIDLSSNQIREVSKKIAYMQNLEYIDISNNSIEKFDASVFKLMKKLDQVHFTRNPFYNGYESSLTYQKWLHYPTYNTIAAVCKNRFLEKKKNLYEVSNTRIQWFVELYKHVRFTVQIEYFNIKRQATQRKAFRCAMDKRKCNLFEWDLI